MELIWIVKARAEALVKVPSSASPHRQKVWGHVPSPRFYLCNVPECIQSSIPVLWVQYTLIMYSYTEDNNENANEEYGEMITQEKLC